MSVKIKKRLYNNPFRSEQVDWLLGNTGDAQVVALTVSVGTDDEFTESNKMNLVYPDKVNKSSGTPWKENGFDVGDTVFVQFRWINLGVDLGVFTIAQWLILEINDLEMRVDTQATPMPTGYDTLPYEEGQGADGFRFMNAKMFAYKTPEALDVTYNHLENENSDSIDMTSVIDGNTTKLLAEQTHQMSPGVWNEMTKLGYQSGMSILNARIRGVGGAVADPNNGEGSLTGQYNSMLSAKYKWLFDSWQNNEAESIPLTVVNPLDSSVHGQQRRLVGMDDPFSPGLIDYGLTHFGDQMMIHESLTGYTTDLNIDFSIRFNSIQAPISGSKIILSVFEFTTIGTIGANVPMALLSKKVVAEWANPQVFAGQTKNFNGVYSLNVVQNRSYSLVVELESTAVPPYGLNQFSPPQNQVNFTVIKSNIIMQDTSGSGNVNTLQVFDYETVFEIEIAYIISSIFQDISTFEDPITPPDYMINEKSLTDNFLINAYPEYNNPNLIIKNNPDFTKQLGNTGWFDENFNTLPNDFNVESVQYFDLTGNPLDQIDYSIPVRVIMRVSGIQNLGTDEDIGFGFSWIPTNEDNYKSNERGFHENTFVSIGGEYNSFQVNTNYTTTYEGFGYNGIQMDTEDLFFHVDGSELVAEITFRPSSEFSSFFDAIGEDDRNYILWISVADSTLVTNFSNRVSLLADFNQMEKTIPPLGEYSDIENKFIEHPEDEFFDGVDEYEGFVEDDILCRLPFRINLSEPIKFLKMTFGVQVRNLASEDVFELQNYPVDLTQFLTDSSGVHQIDFDSTRGFKMVNGNNKNWVKIERDDLSDAGSSKAYIAYYGLKIRWEDWLSRADVPVEFFDNTELNDGFNNDWLQYLRTTGHEIDFVVYIDAEVDGTIGQYKNTFKFNFNDYDENDLVFTEHKYFRASDDFEITQPASGGIPQGIILNDDFTKVQIDYTRTDGSKWVLNETYAVTTIEIDKGAGQFEHRQLSSVIGSEGDNPLIPVPGQTNLLLSLLNNDETLRTICLVDPGKLEESNRYKISGRVGCHESDVVPVLGLYEGLYENKYE